MKKREAQTLEVAMSRETDPLGMIVLKWSDLMRRYVDAVKKGPAEKELAELRNLIDPEKFERIGTYQERVNWDQYCTLLRNWGLDYNWDCAVRRITPEDGYVLLELTEFGEEDATKVMKEVNSLSVYEFDENNKITHLAIYLQSGKKDQVMEVWTGIYSDQ